VADKNLAALIGSVIFAALISTTGARAQGAFGPHLSNPGAIPPEELKRQERISEDYCRSQPGRMCKTDMSFTPEQLKKMSELKRYPGPYVPPDPTTTAPMVTTSCKVDPNNPQGPQLCTVCRANPANPEKPLCARLIPGQGVDIPPLPASESRAQ
jgi:hypothetical protein